MKHFYTALNLTQQSIFTSLVCKTEKRLVKYLGLNAILLTKTTAAQNEVSLSYHRVRRLYFLAVVFVATMLYYTEVV